MSMVERYSENYEVINVRHTGFFLPRRGGFLTIKELVKIFSTHEFVLPSTHAAGCLYILPNFDLSLRESTDYR